MFLYKIEIELAERTVHLVVMSESDEKAFDSVEGHLARHFLSPPAVKEVSIVEKKRADRGAGYVIE